MIGLAWTFITFVGDIAIELAHLNSIKDSQSAQHEKRKKSGTDQLEKKAKSKTDEQEMKTSFINMIELHSDVQQLSVKNYSTIT